MATTKITTPELFDFSATNTALQLPTGTTAQRPTSPSAGEWRFNTTEKYVEFWDGGAWRQIDTEELPNPDDFPSQNFNVNTYFGTDASHKIDAKFNEAANFNGSSSAIIIQDGGIGNNGTARVSFSVSIWVNTEATSASAIISDYDGVDYSFYLQMNANGTLNIGNYMDGVGSFTSGTATINDGNWHNLVLINNTSDNTQKLFVDGNSTPDINHTLTSGTKNAVAIQVGYYATGGNFLKGKLDQIRFFNAPIISSDITALYSNETTTTAATLNFPVGAGCVAAYQLDGDASDVGGTYGGVTTDIGYTGLRFQPDFVWVKRRVSGSESHALYDSIRGINKQLSSDNSLAEATNTAPYEGFTSFDTNGFTVDNNGATNRAPNSYVAWAFKGGGAPTATNSAGAGNVPTAGSVKIDGANSTTALAGATPATNISANTGAGFSIVKYTGPASNSTIGHGLGVTPSMIIQKPTGSGNWYVYFAPGVIDATSTYYYMVLDSDASKGTTGSAAPTTTTFNAAGSGAHIAYCFADIAGYQKIGNYTGTGASGNFIETGFEPAFVLAKPSSSTGSWLIMDNKRGADSQLYPNLSSTEYNDSDNYFYSNGFEMKSNGNWNTSGVTYIYLAIAADKDSSVPTQANSFSPTLYTGNGGTQNIYTPFAPDFTWIKQRTGSNANHLVFDTIRGAFMQIMPNTTNGTVDRSSADKGVTSFNSNGFTVKDTSAGDYEINGPNGGTYSGNGTYVSWCWKAGGLPTINSDGDNTSIVSANQAAGFSIIRYKGNGNNDSSVGHGLNSPPEMFIYKRTSSTGSWNIIHKDVNNYQAYLEFTSGTTNNDSSMQSPTNSVIRFNTNSPSYNGSGQDWLIYAFHSVSGYQKIGSYQGNAAASSGTTQPIYTTDNGLSGGANGFTPSFLLIKSTTLAGQEWNMIDSARGRREELFADLPNPEQTNSNDNGVKSFDTNGFTLGDGTSYNRSGETYIYLAIK
jgi:hypothetical protein